MKRLAKKLLQKMDIEFNTISGRAHLENAQTVFRLASITTQPFHTIIDVGANEGQFASLARTAFPLAKIIAFEPIPACFTILMQHFKDDKSFEAFNVALGNKNQEKQFHLTDYSATSSFLPLSAQHKKEFLETGNEQIISVSERTFEEVYGLEKIADPCLLKIDVQGYEMEVLRNNESLVMKAHTILVETSYTNIYEGQPLFADVFLFLHERGFVFKGNYEQLRGINTNQIMQADAIFVNTRFASNEL
jgi:FkbM family methyltransferase